MDLKKLINKAIALTGDKGSAVVPVIGGKLIFETRQFNGLCKLNEGEPVKKREALELWRNVKTVSVTFNNGEFRDVIHIIVNYDGECLIVGGTVTEDMSEVVTAFNNA